MSANQEAGPSGQSTWLQPHWLVTNYEPHVRAGIYMTRTDIQHTQFADDKKRDSFETLVYSPLYHLMRLLAWGSFNKFTCRLFNLLACKKKGCCNNTTDGLTSIALLQHTSSFTTIFTLLFSNLIPVISRIHNKGTLVMGHDSKDLLQWVFTEHYLRSKRGLYI